MSESKKKRYAMCPFVVHEHVLETTMTRVSSCMYSMYVMGNVSDVMLKLYDVRIKYRPGMNTVPAEYRQIKKTVHIVSVVFTFTLSFVVPGRYHNLRC